MTWTPHAEAQEKPHEKTLFIVYDNTSVNFFKKIVIYDIDLNILNNGIPLKCVNISKKLEAEVEKNSNQMEYPVTIRIMLR